MDNKLSIQIELIINYLNNIININLLLTTIGLIFIYWGNKNTDLKQVVFNIWNLIIFVAIFIGVSMIIVNLFIYRELVTEFTKTGFDPNNPYSPKPVKHLSNLNIVFWMDLFVMVLLFIGYFGKKHEKRIH